MYEQISFIRFRFSAWLFIFTRHRGHLSNLSTYFYCFLSPLTNKHILQMLCPQGKRIYGTLGGAISSKHIVQVLVYISSATFLEIGQSLISGYYSFYINFLAYYLALSYGLPINYFSGFFFLSASLNFSYIFHFFHFS